MFALLIATLRKSPSRQILHCTIKKDFSLLNTCRFLSSFESGTGKENKQDIVNSADCFSILKSFVAKKKCISLDQIRFLVDDISKNGPCSDAQMVFLLECCGNLAIFEENKLRKKEAENAWQLIKKWPLKIEHYNRRLQTDIENEKIIDMEVFFQEISEAGLKPNNSTNVILHSYYCFIGDMEQAEKIFEKLQESGTKLAEDVFNSIIMGHGRAKNINAALRTVQMMQSKGMPCGRSTFEVILEVYSELNKEEEASKILSKVSGFSISPRCLLNVQYQFLKHKKTTFAEKVLEKVPNDISTATAVQAALRLILLKEYEAAYKVTQLGMNKNNLYKFAYLPHFLAQHASVEVIIDYCERMVSSKINILAFECALLSSIQIENVENAMKILQKMKNLNMVIKEHYLYPLVCLLKKRQSSNLSKYAEVLKFDPCTSYSIYYEYVFPSLEVEDPCITCNKLDEYLDKNLFRHLGMFMYLISVKRIEDAANFVSGMKLVLPSTRTVYFNICYSYLSNVSDVKHFMRIIAEGICSNNEEEGNSFVISKFLACLCTVTRRNPLIDESFSMKQDESVIKLLQHTVSSGS